MLGHLGGIDFMLYHDLRDVCSLINNEESGRTKSLVDGKVTFSLVLTSS